MGGGCGLVAGGREDGRFFFVLSCLTSADYIISFSISGSPAFTDSACVTGALEPASRLVRHSVLLEEVDDEDGKLP